MKEENLVWVLRHQIETALSWRMKTDSEYFDMEHALL